MTGRWLSFLACALLAGRFAPGAAAAGKPAGSKARLLPIPLALPRPQFIGTQGKKFKFTEHMRKPTDKKRPPFLAPPGTKNVALGKPVCASEDDPVTGDLEQVTDGDKAGNTEAFVELGQGRQYVQIDLKALHSIYAIVVWHFHGEPRFYHDVVIQIADDPDFITSVRTVFNNDCDNSSGLGIGKDLEYMETYEGELVDLKGHKARYVRLYSQGSTASDMNEWTEVEVHGIPAK